MAANLRERTNFFNRNNLSAVTYETKMKLTKSIQKLLIIKTSHTDTSFKNMVPTHLHSRYMH